MQADRPEMEALLSRLLVSLEYGACSRRDWRRVSFDTIQYDPLAIRQVSRSAFPQATLPAPTKLINGSRIPLNFAGNPWAFCLN